MQDWWLSLLQQHRVIAVIRISDFTTGLPIARAAARGGIRLIEITWNSDRPAELVKQLQQELPDCIIGAGTLLKLEQLEAAIASGAQFLFSPHVDLSLIDRAVAAKIPIVSGALTPTEIITAWQRGATCVKVFPISAVGGANYLKSLRSPLDKIPLIPTGGVTIENAKTFIEAGAIAVGLSGQLFPQAAIASEDWDAISQRSATLVRLLSQGRI